MQKNFTVDFLTKRIKPNEGELPKYYIENNHPPIISPEKFEMVQEEIKRRSEAGGFMRSVSPLSGRIICGDCGGFYGRKVWHSNTAYRSYAWHCNNKFTKRQYCKTPTVKTEAIEKCFIDAFNSLLERKDEIAENYRLCLSAITDDTALVKRKDALEKRILEETEKTKDFLFRRSKSDEDLNAVNSQYNEYISGIEALQKERQEIVSQISLLGAKKENVKAFLKILRKRKTPLTEFDPLLWQTVVNHMVIYINNYSVEIIDMFYNLRQIILDSVACEPKEVMWAKLPSYYVGDSFVRLIPFKNHINIEAKAVFSHEKELSDYSPHSS